MFRTKKYGVILLLAFEINAWRVHTRFRLEFLRCWSFASRKPFLRRGATGLNTALSKADSLTICTVLHRYRLATAAHLDRFIRRGSGVGGLAAQDSLTPIF